MIIRLDNVKSEDRAVAFDIVDSFHYAVGVRVGYWSSDAPHVNFSAWRTKTGVTVRASYKGEE